MRNTSRRQFLRALGFLPGAALLSRYRALAASEKGKTKIRDIKVMMLQGPRTYTLVKVESDAGLHGIGEAYGSPGVGVKEGILALKPELIGKDPLGIDVLLTGLGWRTDGSAHMLIRAASGIEMALWDLASETVLGHGDWMDDVVIHEDRVIKDGHIQPADRPGLGLELNPDVVKAHLAQGESYWDSWMK